MAETLNIKELPLEMGKGANPRKPISESLIIFGKVLQVLEGLTNRDAQWVLKKSLKELEVR